MLQKVVTPYNTEVSFTYGPLGRRMAKQHKGEVMRWVWDGNVPLHEWKYKGVYPPQSKVVNDEVVAEKEPVEDLITWVYEDGSFVPTAKIEGEKQYSIVTDYLGTPTHSYDESGNLVWERELDCYGAARKVKGDKNFVPQLIIKTNYNWF